MIDGRSRILEWTAACVALILMVDLSFLLIAVVFFEIPKANENAFTLLIGILSANVGIVVGFFFGYSMGNKKKDDTIDTQAQAISAAQAALPAVDGATPVIPVAAGEQVTVKAESP